MLGQPWWCRVRSAEEPHSHARTSNPALPKPQGLCHLGAGAVVGSFKCMVGSLAPWIIPRLSHSSWFIICCCGGETVGALWWGRRRQGRTCWGVSPYLKENYTERSSSCNGQGILIYWNSWSGGHPRMRDLTRPACVERLTREIYLLRDLAGRTVYVKGLS